MGLSFSLMRASACPLAGAAGAKTWNGAVAQMGERVVRNDEVRGSIPLGSTRNFLFSPSDAGRGPSGPLGFRRISGGARSRLRPLGPNSITHF